MAEIVYESDGVTVIPGGRRAGKLYYAIPQAVNGDSQVVELTPERQVARESEIASAIAEQAAKPALERDAAANEIDSDSIDPKWRAMFKWMLDQENRIRVLEGRNTVTAQQAKNALRALMD